MKLVGIVGSNASVSYNRKLLQFIARQYGPQFSLELVEIPGIPMFDRDDDQTQTFEIQNLNRKILQADGVIIATAEHNHTITPALKSVLEWLSFNVHPLAGKPVMIVGASYLDQGTSRAQLHLRQILEAPGVDAVVMPGNEFLLGNALEAFDDNGNLVNKGTEVFLGSVLTKFVRFIDVISKMEGPKPLPEEDLLAHGRIPTTIASVDMAADDWVEQAAKVTGAVEGGTYVKLDRGILTVDQLNYFMKSMPLELTFVDNNNQFLFYNHNAEAEEMFAKRRPAQVGNAIGYCHPPRTHKNVKWVLSQLRAGLRDFVRVHVPTHGPDKFVVHTYQAMHDDEGNYAGVNEYILDYQPLVNWYLQQTKQNLVPQDATVIPAANLPGAVGAPMPMPVPAVPGTYGIPATAPAAAAVDATTGASAH